MRPGYSPSLSVRLRRVERVGEHPVPAGPLSVRWLAHEAEPLRAGAVGRVRVALENAGSARWESRPRDGIYVGYHWLDERGNPIVWDGLRTALLGDSLAPGERVELDLAVRGALPPGRYRLALDPVDEGRFWFAELGGTALELEVDVKERIERRLAIRVPERDSETERALAALEEPLVPAEEAEAVAYLAPGCLPAPDWSRRVLDAHASGYAFVGGSVEPLGGVIARRSLSAQLAPWAPGSGRVPHFPHPLLCPSVVREVEPTWAPDVAGLPALEPPADRLYGEPWLYDGRIALRARPRSGRRRG